jgi:ligand-binding SRPBCC domain-containing protein
MKYIHSFVVKAPLSEVVAFHRHSASMAAITPPPIVVRMHTAPAILNEGAPMDFTLWFGPFPLRWTAQIERLTPGGFVDRQIRGPFASWEHQHSFAVLGEESTAVFDIIHAELKSRGPMRIVGALMWLNLPILFAYRAWQTRRLFGRSRPRVPNLGNRAATH